MEHYVSVRSNKLDIHPAPWLGLRATVHHKKEIVRVG